MSTLAGDHAAVAAVTSTVTEDRRPPDDPLGLTIGVLMLENNSMQGLVDSHVLDGYVMA
jgi:hypothetical protein